MEWNLNKCRLWNVEMWTYSWRYWCSDSCKTNQWAPARDFSWQALVKSFDVMKDVTNRHALLDSPISSRWQTHSHQNIQTRHAWLHISNSSCWVWGSICHARTLLLEKWLTTPEYQVYFRYFLYMSQKTQYCNFLNFKKYTSWFYAHEKICTTL